MNITIHIPDPTVEDVTEYCRVTGIDLHGRLQQELDTFVNNALCQVEQRRRIIKDIANFREAIKELINVR